MKTLASRVPLYGRLPEIYRIRDGELTPPGQLSALLAAVERAFGGVHENIEALYNDLFIETCDDWVIPYLADLLGTTHLKGEPRTLRADVADTIALRRRKGTLGAMERLAANLTGWPCRAVELFGNLAWAQHLNHQRADAGGLPPLADGDRTRFTPPRGGTPALRDPAMLSLLGSPFDAFAYTPDVKRADDGARHVNLPNLAMFLWRLEPYRLPLVVPLAKGATNLGPPPAGTQNAHFAVRFDIDPLDRPLRLFNTYRRPPLAGAGTVEALTEPDRVPGPIPGARLTTGSEAGNPEAYVAVDLFDHTTSPPSGFDLSDVGLQLYLREATFAGVEWTFRGDNLCAWEDGLRRPLQAHEIVIDPDIGRILFGVAAAAERNALRRMVGGSPRSRIFLGYTYGAVGAVGAHPVSRDVSPDEVAGEVAELRPVAALGGPSLQDALANLHNATGPVVVEIRDSRVHELNPATLPGAVPEGGLIAVRLNRSLVIRAVSGHRPTIRLAAPLAFRPLDPGDPSVAHLLVRFEGLFLTRDENFAPAGGPLVGRAAVATLEIDGTTLDPGGHRLRDDTRAPLLPSLDLPNGYGLSAADEDAFEPTPDIVVERSITGALLVDDGYRLSLKDSLIDAGKDVDDEPGDSFAVTATSDPTAGWGPPLDVQGVTLFGRTRVAEASGSGALFLHRLEVFDNQRGCLKRCYFSGDGDRLTPNHACVRGPGVDLAFTDSWFGDPAYGQLRRTTDRRIRTQGPSDDQMGAFGWLLEEHRWTNFGIRLREFTPVGIRPLPLRVT